MAVLLGSIYFAKEGNEVVTVTKYQNKDTIKILNDKGESSKKNISELLSNYILLEPHGYMTFSVVQLQKGLEDIIVTFTKDITQEIPQCVCRQCITDIFAGQIKQFENEEYYGISISQDTCPADIDFTVMLTCDEVSYTEIVAVYKTYTLDYILKFVTRGKYDKVLERNFIDHVNFATKDYGKMFRDAVMKYDNYQGFCRTLKELLYYNNFMYDVYMSYNILPIQLTDIDKIANGANNHKLLQNDVELLSEILCKNIIDTTVIKYDLSIDMNLIKMEHIMVTDGKDIYIVGYHSKGIYNVPLDEIESDENIIKIHDIMNRVGKNNTSIQSAYDKVIFNREKYS